MLQFFLSSWRSGFRSKVFFGVFALGLALVAVAYLSASFSPRQPQTVALDVGLSGLRVALALFAIVLVQDQVGREVERRTVVLTLAYPAGRAAYLLGRYLGVLGLVFAAAAVLAMLLWYTVLTSSPHYDQEFGVFLGLPYGVAVLGILLDVAVVAAFTLLISSLATVPMLPLSLGVLFAVATRGIGPVQDYLARGADGQELLVAQFGPAVRLSGWLIPDLSRLDWRIWPMYGLPLDAAAISWAVVSALGYAGVMLGLSILCFSRREFS